MSDFAGQSFGRYQILEPLGEGGMATVFKAFDTRLERNVAVKVIRMGAFAPDQVVQLFKRFEREAKSLGKLLHPNIVSVIDYGEEQGVPYLVMVYLPGGTLKEMMGKPMPWKDAARQLLPVARALQFAHQQGIIHRDIKPSNILITLSGEPMLSDFGIAKILEVSETTQLTGTGVGIGTPEYMSPEQGLGKAIDGRADQYSLGIVFYELVTGRKPFTADTPMSVIFKHVTDPLPNPSQFVPGLPDMVEQVLQKALAKKPEDRYNDMGDFANALEELGGNPAVRMVATPMPTLLNPLPTSGPETLPVNIPTMAVETGPQMLVETRIPPPAIKEKSKGEPQLTKYLIAAALAILLLLISVFALGFAGLLPGPGPAIAAPAAPATSPSPVIPMLATPTDPAPVSVVEPEITRTAVTIIDPTITAFPTAADTQANAPSCSLQMCDSSSEDVCVYSFAPQTTGLIVGLKFKQQLDTANLPLLIINGKEYKCEMVNTYPDRLYCSGALTAGNSDITIQSSENQTICSGSLIIPKYVAPSPTPKKSKKIYP